MTSSEQRTEYYRHQADEGSFLSSAYNQEVLGLLLERVPAGIVRRVCDVGSGLGSNLPTLAAQFPEAPLISVDLNLQALSRGRLSVPSARPAAGSAEALPLKSESMDLVVCTEVLEHVPDLGGAVRELARIVRAGGFVVISSPNYLNPMGARKRIMDRRMGDEYWDPWGGHAGYERLMLPGLVRSAVSAFFFVRAIRGAGYLMAWIPLGYRRIGALNDRHPFIAMGGLPLLRDLAINRYLLLQRKVAP